jgi:flagellar basal-body rod modification protein FlgD
MTAAITSSTAATTAATTTPEGSNSVLGQNDFLKLMIAQLQAQNPLQPSNTNEFLSELAQITQVEQTTNLANANELSGAVQLIGRTVSYNSPTGAATGKVESVQSTATGTTVTVEGVAGVKISSVTEVH